MDPANLYRSPQYVWLRRNWPVVVCAVAGLCLTVLFETVLFSIEDGVLRARFLRDAENRVHSIQREINAAVATVDSLGTLIATQSNLSEEQFQFTAERIRNSSPSVSVLEWAPRRQKGERTIFPLTYIAPKPFPALLLGLNIEPRAPTDPGSLARDSGTIRISPPVVLVEDKQLKGRGGLPLKSILLYAPVYAFGQTLDTVAARREHLRGFVVCAFRVQDLLDHALKPLGPAGIDIELDDTTDNVVSPIGSHHTRSGRVAQGAKPVFHHAESFRVGGRDWRITLHGYRLEKPLFEPQILATGILMLLLTAAASALVYYFLNRHLAVAAEVKERTRELEFSNRRALAALELKSRILNNLGHELLTPMNGVLGSIELLRPVEASPRAQQLRATLESSAQHLLALLRNLIDLANLDQEKFELIETEFSPATMAETLVSAFGATANSKNLALSLRLSPTLPRTVRADGARVAQVLSILIDNAVKFTESGEIQVDLRELVCYGHEGEKCFLHVQVTDTGIGIDPGLSDRIFTPFEPLDGGATRKRDGLGVGLALAKRIVEQMQGSFGFASVPGEGSRFWFRIPCVAVQQKQTTPAPEAGLDILIVDDNATNRQVVSQLIKKLGHHPHVCGNGEEALQSCHTKEYSLVLMDCMMPVMDGYEATRAIRETDPDLPVVALTACISPEDKERCLAAGMNDHLGKPIDLAQLRAAIERWARPVVETKPVPLG